jgi:hypothetical protein
VKTLSRNDWFWLAVSLWIVWSIVHAIWQWPLMSGFLLLMVVGFVIAIRRDIAAQNDNWLRFYLGIIVGGWLITIIWLLK